MYWRKKKITYSILIPPLKSEIKDLTEKEAEDYFRWYMEHIPERVEYGYSVAAEPPVRRGESHLSGLTEPPLFSVYSYCA